MNMEEFMTTTIISAVTAILVVILGDLLSGVRSLKKLDKHDEKGNSCHQQLIYDHKRQDSDHNKLIQDSEKIKTNSKLLLNLSEKIGGRVENIDKLLATEKEIKKFAYESLTDKQKEMKNSLDKLIDFSEELQKVSYQNTMLLRENEILRAQNKELRVILQQQKKKTMDLEHDYEFER